MLFSVAHICFDVVGVFVGVVGVSILFLRIATLSPVLMIS